MQKLSSTKSNVEWDVIMMGFNGRRSFLTQGTIGAIEGVAGLLFLRILLSLLWAYHVSDSDLVRCLDR